MINRRWALNHARKLQTEETTRRKQIPNFAQQGEDEYDGREDNSSEHESNQKQLKAAQCQIV